MKNPRELLAESAARKANAIFDFDSEPAHEDSMISAKAAFADLLTSVQDPTYIKADITRRIKQAAEHGAALVHNSIDAEEGYRRAYYLCKLALNRSIGNYAQHTVDELRSSEAYDEGLNYVIGSLEEALQYKRDGGHPDAVQPQH